ncbi:MAG: hypothetical protein WA634_16740 [Silvibacterium sp.]
MASAAGDLDTPSNEGEIDDMNLFINKRSIAIIVVSLALVPVIGCNQQQEADTVTLLQSALSDLQQNRSLAEQFVRDVKASVSPSDPNYQQALDSYEDARDAYNHYLDVVENPQGKHPSRSLRTQRAITDARNSAAEFLADSTVALKPSVSTRHIQFQRAIVIPDNLQPALKKLPKQARDYLTQQFDDQVRWRSWGQL